MDDQQGKSDLQIELGRTYRDRITNFQGVATECRHKLGGQILVVLEGADSKERNRAEGYIFDWFRLELVEAAETIELAYPMAVTHRHAGSLESDLVSAGATRSGT